MQSPRGMDEGQLGCLQCVISVCQLGVCDQREKSSGLDVSSRINFVFQQCLVLIPTFVWEADSTNRPFPEGDEIRERGGGRTRVQ